MSLGTIGAGIAIIAFSAYLELVNKEYEKKKEAFENE